MKLDILMIDSATIRLPIIILLANNNAVQRKRNAA